MITVYELYSEIEDALDFSGEILDISTKKDSDNKVKEITIKATCPNYPEFTCEYCQVTIPNHRCEEEKEEEKKHESENDKVHDKIDIASDLKNFAAYEQI